MCRDWGSAYGVEVQDGSSFRLEKQIAQKPLVLVWGPGRAGYFVLGRQPMWVDGLLATGGLTFRAEK